MDRAADALWHTSFDALFVVDDQRRYVRVNPQAGAVLRASPEELLGHRIEHFTPRERWPVLERLWSTFEQRGYLAGAYELLRADGRSVRVEYRAARDFGEGEHVAVVRYRPSPQAHEGATPVRATDADETLTNRERQVLQLAADGLSTVEIAGVLVVGPATAKTHVQHAYRKLGANDRASAVAIGLRRALIT